MSSARDVLAQVMSGDVDVHGEYYQQASTLIENIDAKSSSGGD